jgi:hypothetical protein
MFGPGLFLSDDPSNEGMIFDFLEGSLHIHVYLQHDQRAAWFAAKYNSPTAYVTFVEEQAEGDIGAFLGVDERGMLTIEKDDHWAMCHFSDATFPLQVVCILLP